MQVFGCFVCVFGWLVGLGFETYEQQECMTLYLETDSTTSSTQQDTLFQ